MFEPLWPGMIWFAEEKDEDSRVSFPPELIATDVRLRSQVSLQVATTNVQPAADDE